MSVKDTNLTLKASGALTTTTTGSEVDLGTRHLQPLTFHLNITAVSGTTPTMSVKLQHCDTSGGTFVDLGTFAGATTATMEDFLTLKPKRYMKYVATIAGTTPSYTFSVDVLPAGRSNKY